MAPLNYGQVLGLDSTAEILAILAAGQWPDGTSWSMPTSGAGGGTTTRIWDGTNYVGILPSAPVGTEYGLVVRNIPSGTQAVSGSVTISNAVGSPVPFRLGDGTY